MKKISVSLDTSLRLLMHVQILSLFPLISATSWMLSYPDAANPYAIVQNSGGLPYFLSLYILSFVFVGRLSWIIRGYLHPVYFLNLAAIACAIYIFGFQNFFIPSIFQLALKGNHALQEAMTVWNDASYLSCMSLFMMVSAILLRRYVCGIWIFDWNEKPIVKSPEKLQKI